MRYIKYNHMDKPPTSLGQWLTNRMWRDMVKWHGKMPGAIYEIGPGRGHVGIWARTHDICYCSVDACEQNVTKMKLLNLSCFCRIVPPMPNLNGYTTVVMLNVLEHMPSHDKAVQLLSEIDKSVLIAVPQYEGYDFWRNTFDHSYPCTRERMKGLLKATGFSNIRVEWHSFIFHGWAAWLWSRLGRLLPLELPAAMFPDSWFCRKVQKFGSFFALRIWCSANKG